MNQIDPTNKKQRIKVLKHQVNSLFIYKVKLCKLYVEKSKYFQKS